MGNMLTAKVTIEGTRPVLWSHFGPEAIPLEREKERTGVAGNDPEEWRQRVLMTKERQLYFEPTYIFGCIRDGARYTKKNRGSIQPAVSATLLVANDRVLVNRFVPEEPVPTDPEEPVYLDVRSVRNPNTKGRNVRYRVAASPGWLASFSLIWDKTIVSRAEMNAAAIDAGRLVGLADGRAIGFGRFSVLAFDVGEG